MQSLSGKSGGAGVTFSVPADVFARQVGCWINETFFLFSDARYQAAMDPATPLENFYLTEGWIILNLEIFPPK